MFLFLYYTIPQLNSIMLFDISTEYGIIPGILYRHLLLLLLRSPSTPSAMDPAAQRFMQLPTHPQLKVVTSADARAALFLVECLLLQPVRRR